MEKKAHYQSRVLLLSKNQKSTMCAIKVGELEIATVSQFQNQGHESQGLRFSQEQFKTFMMSIYLLAI